MPGYGACAARKCAVAALTSVPAEELPGREVTVHAVAPGSAATALVREGRSRELVDRPAAEPPMERLGGPEDVSAVVSFLTGPDGRWVHGQTVRANGGLV